MGTCSFLLMYICVCQQVSSPSVHPLLLKLRDAERQRAHKVVPAGQVPVPDLHRQPAVLVRLLQITVRHRAQEGDRQRQRNQAQHFISHFSDKQITDLIFWLCHWCPERELPYNVKVSFHKGFRQHLMVLVFCLLSLLGSGMSFSLT